MASTIFLVRFPLFGMDLSRFQAFVKRFVICSFSALNPRGGSPLLVGCPRLLIQCICSYSIFKAVPASAT
jgi:hypothetical protein